MSGKFLFRLAVHVVEGKDMPDVDLIGTCDPYVVVKVGDEKYTTKVIKKSQFPIWNEKFEFGVEKGAKHVDFTLYDSDKGKIDDSLGHVSIPFENLRHGPNDFWIDLPERNKKHPKIHVVIHQLPRINIKLQSAKGLKAMDLTGKSDPYVIFDYLKNRKMSKVVSKSLDPVWDEEFEFDIWNIDEPIFLSVMDKDLLTKDDLMGKLVITMTMLKNGENKLALNMPDKGVVYLKVDASGLPF
jgi:Ca2+-dependent lipid-binding protein